MTRIGVIGIGYWGKQLLRNMTEVADVRICHHTGNSPNARAVREMFPDIEITTNIESVLSAPRIDAVAIATPLGTHYNLVHQALNAGKDVFVEKPLASTLTEARELQQVATENDQVLFVGYIYMYHPLIQILHRTNSEIDSITFSWEQLGRFDTDIYLDIVCHPLSIAHYLTGSKPNHIISHNSKPVVSSPDIVSIQAVFLEDVVCEIAVNRVAPESRKSFFVNFADSTGAYWTDDTLHWFDSNNRKYTATIERHREPLFVECEHFIETINDRTKPVTDGEFGVAVNESVTAITEH